MPRPKGTKSFTVKRTEPLYPASESITRSVYNKAWFIARVTIPRLPEQWKTQLPKKCLRHYRMHRTCPHDCSMKESLIEYILSKRSEGEGEVYNLALERDTTMNKDASSDKESFIGCILSKKLEGDVYNLTLDENDTVNKLRSKFEEFAATVQKDPKQTSSLHVEQIVLDTRL